ncbi:DUF523 domain-containing protein [Ensifer soli]|uniref:DUF523 domain-containing protein n=1 Tax=Ciceribacter sp. sgz301302 TaxID=3342379 RepID=UPI0035BB38BD
MGSNILVSACLMGLPVRYDAKAKPLASAHLQRWRAEGRLVSVCPELSGGFAIPRAPAEIADGLTGDDVLDGRARVIERGGRDVTAAFLAGAEAALALARETGCRHALLIDGSPSCGSSAIHDGRFSGRRHAGNGVTAALLRRHGITLYSGQEIEALALAVDGDAAEGP